MTVRILPAAASHAKHRLLAPDGEVVYAHYVVEPVGYGLRIAFQRDGLLVEMDVQDGNVEGSVGDDIDYIEIAEELWWKESFHDFVQDVICQLGNLFFPKDSNPDGMGASVPITTLQTQSYACAPFNLGILFILCMLYENNGFI